MTYFTRYPSKFASPPPDASWSSLATECSSGFVGLRFGGYLDYEGYEFGEGPLAWIEVDTSAPRQFAHDECLPPEQFDITPLHDHRTGELVELHRHQKPPWCWVPAYGAPKPCAFCGRPVR